MPNPKTAPSGVPYPEPEDGWVHKCDVDDYLDRHLPIPTQVVSNEEYCPIPQTRKQRSGPGGVQRRRRQWVNF